MAASEIGVLTLTGSALHITLDSFVRTVEEEGVEAAQAQDNGRQQQQQPQQQQQQQLVGPGGQARGRAQNNPDLSCLPEEGPSADLPLPKNSQQSCEGPSAASPNPGLVDSQLLEACLPEGEEDL